MPYVCLWGLWSLPARPNRMPFWQDFDLCGRHQWLDVQQSSPIERQQNWGDVVLLRSTCTWTLFQIGHLIQPVQAVRNLGIWLDSDCSMTIHFNKTTRSCYASLRKNRSIAAPFLFDVWKLHITSFILLKIDYGNSIQVGLPPRATSACHQRSCQNHKHQKKTWPCHSSSWSPLTTHSPKNWLQNLFICFKVSPGSSTVIPAFTRSAQIPARRGLRSATRGSLVKSSARRAILDDRYLKFCWTYVCHSSQTLYHYLYIR